MGGEAWLAVVPRVLPFEVGGATGIEKGEFLEAVGGGLAFRDAMAAEVPFSEEGGVVGVEDLRECWNARIESGVRVGGEPSLT